MDPDGRCVETIGAAGSIIASAAFGGPAAYQGVNYGTDRLGITDTSSLTDQQQFQYNSQVANLTEGTQAALFALAGTRAPANNISYEPMRFEVGIEEPALISKSVAPAGVEEASIPFWRFTEVRPAIRALKNAGLVPEKIREVIQSFQPGTLNTRTLTTDEFGIRFYGGQANPISPYLGPTFPNGNARELLAPWTENTLQYIQQWKIPSGTTILEGRTAPAFGQPGGGNQIYVPNPRTTLQYP